MAEYLDDDTGKEEYSLAFHQKQMKRLDQNESQIKERVTKKMRMGLYEGIENQLNEEVSSTEQPATEENEAESCQVSAPYYVPIKKGIFTDGSELHENFKQCQKLELKERDRMASGISGILDFNNDDNKFKRKRIKDKYFNKYKVDITNLDHNLEKKWDTRHFERFYVCIQQLDAIQNCQHILNPRYPNNVPEGDYTYSIWLPFFQRLFDYNKIIRVKPGETVPDDSTSEKNYIYGEDSSHTIGFKIDIRFIYDFEDCEFDMCSLECSREGADDSKGYEDHSELIREGKTNTTSLFSTSRNADDVHTWIVQACGFRLYFSTDNNLFVVIPQFKVNFPTTIGELGDLVEDIEKLFSFKQDIEYLARTAETSLHRSHGLRKGKAIQRMYTRELSLSPPRRLKVVPDTVNWHTPPRNEVSKSLIPKKNTDIYEDTSDTDVGLYEY